MYLEAILYKETKQSLNAQQLLENALYIANTKNYLLFTKKAMLLNIEIKKELNLGYDHDQIDLRKLENKLKEQSI